MMEQFVPTLKCFNWSYTTTLPILRFTTRQARCRLRSQAPKYCLHSLGPIIRLVRASFHFRFLTFREKQFSESFECIVKDNNTFFAVLPFANLIALLSTFPYRILKLLLCSLLRSLFGAPFCALF